MASTITRDCTVNVNGQVLHLAKGQKVHGGVARYLYTTGGPIRPDATVKQTVDAEQDRERREQARLDLSARLKPAFEAGDGDAVEQLLDAAVEDDVLTEDQAEQLAAQFVEEHARDSDGGTDEGPPIEGQSEPGDGNVERPPLSGSGSGRDAWAAYAASIEVGYPEDASRDDIVAAVEAAQEA